MQMRVPQAQSPHKEMNTMEYYAFVEKTTRYKDAPEDEQKLISLYGLAGEIGSLVTTVKKQLISHARNEIWHYANQEIFEEIGDILWYSFSLLRLETGTKFRILRADLNHLVEEIEADTPKSVRIQTTLSKEKALNFLSKAKSILKQDHITFGEYQDLAYLTARTEDDTLLEVCLSVLTQLSAEILRKRLPPNELQINQNLADREIETIIGEIVWHVSAVASIYKRDLEDVLSENVKKVTFREDRGTPTKLHDAYSKIEERFPRKMQIAFLTTNEGVAQMYMDGKAIGDPLDDNIEGEDGYRFHDVLHIANAAHLGWSPVLRKLLGRKRRKEPEADRVQDGARGQLEEEVIVKFIHSEGKKIAQSRPKPSDGLVPVALFTSREDISFNFLKTLRFFTAKQEVSTNKDWEWEDAILSGYVCFHQLRLEEQGTIFANLIARKLEFSPYIYQELDGPFRGQGQSSISIADFYDVHTPEEVQAKFLTEREVEHMTSAKTLTQESTARIIACKRSILSCMSITSLSQKNHRQIEIFISRSKEVSSKVSGRIRERMWEKGIVTFRLALNSDQNSANCLAAAIGKSDTED